MGKGKSKPGREKKKPKQMKSKTEVRKINPAVPSPKTEKVREEAQKAENVRVRQAVHGSSFMGDEERFKSGGVKILSGKPMEIPKKPTILSKHTKP